MQKAKIYVYFTVFILTLITTGIVISSCNPLFIGPAGRYNNQDEKASLIRLDAYPYGSDKMFIAWNWLDQERAFRENFPLIDPQWDKIVVKASREDPPTSRLGGSEFSVNDANWYKVFSDLEYENEYWFALWAHEKDGKWLSPIYVKRSVESPSLAEEHISGVYNAYKLNLDNNEYIDLSEVPEATAHVQERVWYFLFFENFNQNLIVTSAELTIDIEHTDSSGSLIINPVRWNNGDFFSSWPQDEASLERQIATETFVRHTIESQDEDDGVETYDITGVVNRAMYHGTDILVFRATEGSTIRVNTTSPIEIEYEGVWKW